MLTPLPRLTLDETLKSSPRSFRGPMLEGDAPDEKSLSDYRPHI